jgi:outer membrane protein assembly factor BamE (lipoprotein component of BamABCDE complex)
MGFHMPRKTAMSKVGLLAVLLLPTQISCVGHRVWVASQVESSMIGNTKEQVLLCMGAPPQKASAGKTEVWSYTSGGDLATLGFFGSSITAHRYCVVNVVFTDDRVTAIKNTGRTGSHDEQCAFALQNCFNAGP